MNGAPVATARSSIRRRNLSATRRHDLAASSALPARDNSRASRYSLTTSSGSSAEVFCNAAMAAAALAGNGGLFAMPSSMKASIRLGSSWVAAVNSRSASATRRRSRYTPAEGQVGEGRHAGLGVLRLRLHRPLVAADRVVPQGKPVVEGVEPRHDARAFVPVRALQREAELGHRLGKTCLRIGDLAGRRCRKGHQDGEQAGDEPPRPGRVHGSSRL